MKKLITQTAYILFIALLSLSAQKSNAQDVTKEKTLTATFKGLNVSDNFKFEFNDGKAIVFHDNKLYLRRYYNFEQELLNFISSKNTPNNESNFKAFDPVEIKRCLNALFPIESSDQNNDEIDWQKVAVANAMNKKFSIIACPKPQNPDRSD